MKLPEGSVCLIIVCLAGGAMATCDSGKVLQCPNLELFNEYLLIARASHPTVCPLLPPLYSCLERYLSSCPVLRNIYWMVRREVFSYVCNEGSRAYLASADCYTKNNAHDVMQKCEAQLQKNLIKHNACFMVDEFVTCLERDMTDKCGDLGGCVMGNMGRAYVGTVKDLLKCNNKVPLVHCEVPENMTTQTVATTTVPTPATKVTTARVTTPTTPTVAAPEPTPATPSKGQDALTTVPVVRDPEEAKTTLAIDSDTEETISDLVTPNEVRDPDNSAASLGPCRLLALWFCVAAAILCLIP